MDNIFSEGIIPMNFNINNYRQHSNKPTTQQTKTHQDNYYRTNSVNLLNNIVVSIENLIRGNSRKGFSNNDAIILENSIHNKIYEILNSNIYYIDNNVILNNAQQFNLIYKNQFIQDCERYHLTNSTTLLVYNTNDGIVKFNPAALYNIISEWCSTHQTHQLTTDMLICD